jgi:putative ABC transport system permease protein
MLKLALRNVFRNRRRSILTGLSIVLSVSIFIFLWSLVQGEAVGIFGAFIKIQSGHVRLMNPDYAKRERMLPLQYYLADYDGLRAKVAQLPGVKIATGRIKFGVLLDYQGNTKQTLGIGFDPQAEEAILGLSKKMVAGRLIGVTTDEVNIGILMAQDLGLKQGDILTVVTQTVYGSFGAKNFKVVGIFNYGSPNIDRHTFFISIPTAQQLLDLPGSVTEIFIMLKDQYRARPLAAELNKIFAGRYIAQAWQDQGAIYMFMVMINWIFGFIMVIIVLLSAFTILNTMFMTVLERTREIGMMKALGMRNGQLVSMVMLEAMVLGVLASGIGAVLGTIFMYLLTIYGIDVTTTVSKMDFPTPYVYYGVFDWLYTLAGFLLGVAAAVLASIFPALRAARLEPTEALHEI